MTSLSEHLYDNIPNRTRDLRDRIKVLKDDDIRIGNI